MFTELQKIFKDKLASLSGRPVGNYALLSLTDTEINLAVLVTGQEQGIVRLASSSMPDADTDLAGAMEELLQREVVDGLQLPDASLSLAVLASGHWAYAERFLLPRLPHKELLQSVSWDVEQGVPFAAGSYVFDALYLDEGTDKVDKRGKRDSFGMMETRKLSEASGMDQHKLAPTVSEQYGAEPASAKASAKEDDWQRPVLAAAVPNELLQILQQVAEKLELNLWGVTVRAENAKQVSFEDAETDIDADVVGTSSTQKMEDELPILGNFYNRKEEAELRTTYAELFWLGGAILEGKALLRMGATGSRSRAFEQLPLEKLCSQAAAVVAAALVMLLAGSGIIRGVAQHRVAVAEAELANGQLAVWRNRSAESGERERELQRLKSGWDSIHRNQPQWALRLNALGKSMPKNCWLVKLSEVTGDKVILEGRALDMVAVNSFMERVRKTGQWQSVQLAQYGEAVGNKAQQDGTLGFRIELRKGGAVA